MTMRIVYARTKIWQLPQKQRIDTKMPVTMTPTPKIWQLPQKQRIDTRKRTPRPCIQEIWQLPQKQRIDTKISANVVSTSTGFGNCLKNRGLILAIRFFNE